MGRLATLSAIVRPSSALTLNGMRTMIMASGIISACVGALGFMAIVQALTDTKAKELDGGLLLALGALGVAAFAKAAVEISAVVRLRGIPSVPLSSMPVAARFTKFGSVWLLAFWTAVMLAVANLVYVVLLVVVICVGFVVALLITLGTLLTVGKGAFSTWWWVVQAMGRVLEYEGRAWTMIFDHPVSAAVATALIVSLLVGPTACAVYLHVKIPSLKPKPPLAGAR